MLDQNFSFGLFPRGPSRRPGPALPMPQGPVWSSPMDFDGCAAVIAAAPRLSAQVEAQLGWRIINDQCRTSAEELVRCNLYLVRTIASPYFGRGLSAATLISQGNQGLLMAVETFDPSQGARFSTAATWWIKNAMKTACLRLLQPRPPATHAAR